jgi:hypothetical protein
VARLLYYFFSYPYFLIDRSFFGRDVISEIYIFVVYPYVISYFIFMEQCDQVCVTESVWFGDYTQ